MAASPGQTVIIPRNLIQISIFYQHIVLTKIRRVLIIFKGLPV